MKKRKRKKKNNYFTQVHEDAIIEYCASIDGDHRNVLYRDVIRPVFVEMDHLAIYNQYDLNREKKEFMDHLWGEIRKWETYNLKENEKKVLEAIKILFNDADNIEIFNKKAIYLYIREITNLNTKQVLNSLNKFRFEYGVFKKRWNE